MVKEILLPALECNLIAIIDGAPRDLYTGEFFLQCNEKKVRLGVIPLDSFVESFVKAFNSTKDSFVTILGCNCAVSVKHSKDSVVYKYEDGHGNLIGHSVLNKDGIEKWLKILKELDGLIKEGKQA